MQKIINKTKVILEFNNSPERKQEEAINSVMNALRET